MQTYALPAVTLELAASCPGAGKSLPPPPDGWGQQSTEPDVGAQTLVGPGGSAINLSGRRWPESTQQKLWPGEPPTPQGHSLGLGFFLFKNIYLLGCTRSWWQHVGSSIFIAASEIFS